MNPVATEPLSLRHRDRFNPGRPVAERAYTPPTRNVSNPFNKLSLNHESSHSSNTGSFDKPAGLRHQISPDSVLAGWLSNPRRARFKTS